MKTVSRMLVSLAVAVSLVGCAGRNDPEVRSVNAATLSGPGEFVGTMEDGIRVYRWEIMTGTGPAAYPHFIYRLFPKKKDDEVESLEGFLKTTTLNYSEPHGKTTINRVLVLNDPI